MTIEPRDLELIAALADGRLRGPERAHALERIEANEALREALADLLRFRETEAGAAGGGLATFEGPRRDPVRRWLLPAAAAAALAAVALVWWPPGGARGDLELAQLGRALATPELGASLADGWYEQSWSVTRGPAPEAEAAGAVVPFRIGVRVMDLEVALQAGQRAEADLLTRRLEALLQVVELSEPQRRAYADVRSAMAAPEPDRALELARLADRLNADQPGLGGEAYRLGKWTEAGRLAAASGNERLLRSRGFRRALGSFLEGSPRPPSGLILDQLRDALDPASPAPDLSRLQSSFSALIAAH